MIAKISRYITKWLIKNNAINSENFEVYNYAVQISIYQLIPYIMVAVITPCIGLSCEGFIMITAYTLLRRNCGGFHFNSEQICLFVSFITLFAILIIGKAVNTDTYYILPALLCTLSLLYYSPMAQELLEEKIVKKKKCRIICIILSLLLSNQLMDFVFKPYQSRWIYLGIILTALLQFPRILSQKIDFRL